MFRYSKKMDHLYNIFINKRLIILYMSEIVWKCFRCNLIFKNEQLADIHRQIENHSITKVKKIAA